MFIKFRRIKFPLSIRFVHTKLLSMTRKVREWNSALQIQQASKQCPFVNAGWYIGSYTADVDLRLGGPRVIFWNKYPGYSFTDPEMDSRVGWWLHV